MYLTLIESTYIYRRSWGASTAKLQVEYSKHNTDVLQPRRSKQPGDFPCKSYNSVPFPEQHDGSGGEIIAELPCRGAPTSTPKPDLVEWGLAHHLSHCGGCKFWPNLVCPVELVNATTGSQYTFTPFDVRTTYSKTI